MAKKTKKQKGRRRKGKPLSQKLREKDEARAELDRQLAEAAAEEEDFEDEALDEDDGEGDFDGELDEEAADEDEAEDDDDFDEDDDSSFEDDLATLEDPDESAPLSSYDDDEEYEDDDEELEAAAQMGHQRYVMAGFFGLWMVVSYVLGRALELAWSRFASTDFFVENLPQLAAVPHEGELISRASLSLVLGGILGAIIVLRYYFKPDVRTWADEVAEELSHVKWPNRKEVGNHTVVVIIASGVITLYLWLLDQFWSFATNLIYQSGA